MKKFKEVTIDIVVNTDKESLWDLTFNRFGEVNVFNPVIEGSHYMSEAKGQVGCERQCALDSKGGHVIERIIDATDHDSFELEIIGGNMPMMEQAFVRFDFEERAPNRTYVKLFMRFRSKPAFMAPLMAIMIKGMLTDMLKGLKYHLETGEMVTKENIKEIKKAYKGLSEGQAFRGLGVGAMAA
ncbi:MAG: SRPBCC family protein [Flavobacteriales bacterium]|nr:SRPBCC family protein [Flavobacteriales bacterium]